MSLLASYSDAWNKVLAGYTPEKKRWDRTYPWLAYVLRPVSFPLTVALLPTGITANQVTFLTLVLGIAACVGLACGTGKSLVFGSACLTLLNLFDCVDGNLARLRGPTPQGRFYDGLVGYFFPLIYFFLGWGLARHPDAFWESNGGGPLPLLIGGGIATITKLLIPSVRHNFLSALGPAWEKSKTTGPAREDPAAVHAGRWYYKMYYNLFDLQAHDFLLLLLVIFQASSLFLIASAFLGIIELLFQLGLLLRRARRLT